MRQLLMVVAAATVLLGQQTDVAKEELNKLQGRWTVKTVIHNGKDETKRDPSIKDPGMWTIKDNKVSYSTPSSHDVFQLDTTKSPKTMDITHFTDKEPKATTMKAIYKIESDTLSVCVDVTGKVYPPSFESKTGSNLRLITLTRAKE